MRTLLIEIHARPEGTLDFPITLTEYFPDNLSSELGGGNVRCAEDWIAWAEGELANARRDDAVLGTIGEQLYELIAQTEAGRMWIAELTQARARGNVVHFRTYFDIQATELVKMPWEVMLPGRRRRPIFVTDHSRVVRGRPDTQDPPQYYDPELPVRLLAIVCDSSDGYHGDDELDAIYRGLSAKPGIWQIEVLREPAQEELASKVKDFRPHVLHIIGATTATSVPEFRIRQPDGESWNFSINDDLDAYWFGIKPPQLLVLNGCHTAKAAMQEVRDIGFNAVISSQLEVYSKPAVKLTAFFYEELAKTGSVEEAVWGARGRMWSAEQRARVKHYDWGRPVLTVFGSPDNILRPDLTELTKWVDVLRRSGPYGYAGQFVNRTEEHRQVWGSSSDHPDRRLVLVSGAEGIGKSQLIRSCMLTWELRGSQVLLADLKRDHPHTGTRGKLPSAAGLLGLCKDIEVYLARPGSDNNDDAGRAIAEAVELLQRDPSSHISGDPYDGALSKIKEGLRLIAGEKRLLLALDHIERIESSGIDKLISRLLWPIAFEGMKDHAGLGQIYAIVGTTPEVAAMIKNALAEDGEFWGGSVGFVHLGGFRHDQWYPLGREFGARRGWEYDGKWRKTHENFSVEYPETWGPERLITAAQIAGM
jgi:hypothetical protein